MFCGNHENVDTAVVWFLFCYCITLIFLLSFFSSQSFILDDLVRLHSFLPKAFDAR